MLAILTDMTNYAEALREVSSSKGEIPSRKGFPGYMYSDLATLFERAGCVRGAKGTLTQLSILTMPADDIGHPIPDLTGYITEGQIVLSRDLDRRGVYPPVNVLPSLSRLMKDGTGGEYTHPDHPALSAQLYAAYARAVQARVLASVVGEEGLAETDRRYLAFGTAFEQTLVHQTARAHARAEHGRGMEGARTPAAARSSRDSRTPRSPRTWARRPARSRGARTADGDRDGPHARPAASCRSSRTSAWRCTRDTSSSTRNACCSPARCCASSPATRPRIASFAAAWTSAIAALQARRRAPRTRRSRDVSADRPARRRRASRVALADGGSRCRMRSSPPRRSCRCPRSTLRRKPRPVAAPSAR